MKKIILSNFCAHQSPSEEVPQKADQEAGASKEADEPPFQPPLPIGPPPPDSPTRIQIKKEKLDDGYDVPDCKPIFDVKCKQEVTPVDSRPMCRRFARGTCTSGSACIFKHEIDLNQLRTGRIYKFCWDFQNKECNRPVCKHLHATIFEEQHYYRTGYLPPSALAHQGPDNVPQNKDGGSPNTPEPSGPTVHQGKSSNTIHEDTLGESSQSKRLSELKRLRNEYNDLGSGRPDFVATAANVKKCKGCDVKGPSPAMMNKKLNEALRSNVRLEEETREIDKKSERLSQVIQSVVILNSILLNKRDLSRSPVSDDQMETMFAELIGVMAMRNNSLSPEPPR